jgi:2-C-methyl-D-erythritol 4-phosphate cytidylyltransferase
VKHGLDALGSDCDIVLVHDAVRPFVSPDMIDMVIQEASLFQAVTVGLPVQDTLKRVDDRGCVEATVPRDRLWCTQTPQAFQTPLLKDAYEAAYREHYYGTDDAGLVERIGGKVKMLTGSFDNIKITTADDLARGELILEMRRKKCG